jgi:catechol 2,3-dioxygenase-like lactoylglutathione lyase family enzyme
VAVAPASRSDPATRQTRPLLGALRQIALASGDDLNASIGFYRDALRLPLLGRFEPPGIAFFDAHGTRLLLSSDAPIARLYFDVADISVASKELMERGIAFKGDPVMVHHDEIGQFGEPDTEEWMQFFDDPAGNLIAIVERRQSRA